jgi:hypothetical protein
MVGGTIFHRWVIQREISRVLVLNLSGKANGAQNTDRRSLSLTAPSLLSRGTLVPLWDQEQKQRRGRVGHPPSSDEPDEDEQKAQTYRSSDLHCRTLPMPMDWNS